MSHTHDTGMTLQAVLVIHVALVHATQDEEKPRKLVCQTIAAVALTGISSRSSARCSNESLAEQLPGNTGSGNTLVVRIAKYCDEGSDAARNRRIFTKTSAILLPLYWGPRRALKVMTVQPQSLIPSGHGIEPTRQLSPSRCVGLLSQKKSGEYRDLRPRSSLRVGRWSAKVVPRPSVG